MNFYLDPNILEIKVVKDLVTLIKGLVENELNTNLLLNLDAAEIYEITHINDPVTDFIKFNIEESGALNWDKDRIDYVSNALFNVKGTMRVFELFQTLMGLWIEGEYDEFPVLKIHEVTSYDRLGNEIIDWTKAIKVTDLDIWVEKLFDALFYLLYYSEISIVIKYLILNIEETLATYSSCIAVGYRVHEGELDPELIEEV